MGSPLHHQLVCYSVRGRICRLSICICVQANRERHRTFNESVRQDFVPPVVSSIQIFHTE